MLFYPISALINAVTSTIVGAIAITKNPKSRLNRSFSYFTFSVAFWSYCYFLWQITKNANSALFWCRALMVFAIFIPATFFHFSVTLINQREKYLNRIIFWYCASVIFFILDFTPLFVKDVRPRLIFPFWPTAGIAYTFFLAMFIGLTTYSHILMFKNWKAFSGSWHNQIKFVSLGTAIGFLGGTTNYPLWYGIKILPIGNVLVSVYVFLVFYAIIRFRLMDINTLLVRITVFLFVYAAVLWVPFYLGYKYGLWKQATWITALLVSIGPFLFIYLLHRAENIIFKERRHYQEVINNLSENMIDIRDIEKLFTTITSTVGEAVKIKFAVIYLRQEEYKSFQLKSCYPKEAKSLLRELIPLNDPLIGILNQRKKPLLSEEIGHQEKSSLDPGVVIPCFGKNGLIGFIVLGTKQNNQMYTNDDLLVLEALSYNTSFAIENCTWWKEIEDRHRKARLQEMDTFSYSLAHEIDNPMSIVYNLTKFLKEHFLKYITDPEERQEVEETSNIMMECSGRVMSMVKAIRQFGQKVTGELETLNLQEVIEGFCRLYMPELKANFILLDKEIPDEPLFVKGVAAELQQVLMIFAKNAIHAMKYSKEKKITLKVIKINRDTARIAVSDMGYGIKKENLHIIFEPFFTSKASTEGTGMGLHNAKGFVLRHNGRIWAESEGEGKGSTLIVELPIIENIKLVNYKKKEGTQWAY